MSKPSPLYGLPSGVDFPAALAEGILERMRDQPPEAMARVTVYLNTQRMRRRLREILIKQSPGFLPRLRLVTDLGQDPLLGSAGPVTSGLGRRLELAVLIDRLLAAEPDLAPRAALYDLADSLAALMDEMRAENVAPEVLDGLDIEGHAAHWARTRRFVSLVSQFFGADAPPDTEARLRLASETQIRLWQENPPQDLVIVAGSTGSRGTTALLMRAVASLPNGALVVPGYDFDMPDHVWHSLDDAGGQEDHPQYRYHKLMRSLNLGPADVSPWHHTAAPDHARNQLISLALRPAPVTDQWIAEGPTLGDLSNFGANITLIEAPDPRSEAQAIALKLRLAIAAGKRVALLTPDRDLTRRVTAALDRWGIRPDDSAGQPLVHSPPGRLLRLIARAMGRRLTADQVLVLLKHPLAFSGPDRGTHLLLTRELELHLRRKGPAYPDAEFLKHWAGARAEPLAPLWAERLGALLGELETSGAAPLPDLIARHRRLAESLVQGTDLTPDRLWERASGQEALAAIEELTREAPEGFTLSLGDYTAMSDGVFSRRQVRETVAVDPRIEILGAQEARVQGADLVILAGLTEGTWPAKITPDPWLNRKMRAQAGLLLPERRVGLSAHDFQMAAAAPEVVLSRAARDAEAETVPSRWMNRITNLLEGLGSNGGPEALARMRARGNQLMQDALVVNRPIVSQPAKRPSPRPPVEKRPNRLSLTEVEKLIRDPYAIYAKHLLRLFPLPSPRPLADARLRGEVLHRVPERFLKGSLPESTAAAARLLMQLTDEVLAEAVAWPAMRAIWRARMADLAEDFVQGVMENNARPVSMEKKYSVEVPGLDGFTLVGKPDRIDLLNDGRVRIIDYKTGAPPTEKQQEIFAKQLHLAAVMASLGAFPEVGPQPEASLAYIQLKAGLKEVSADLTSDDITKILDEFRKLIRAYRDPGRGYTSRRAMLETRDSGDYDDLARYGEWGVTDRADPKDVG